MCFFHSLLKHCLRSLFLNRSNLHSVLRVFHCRCYIFHLRECFAIYCTVLYTLYFIVTVDDVVVVAYFLQTKLQSRFSFSCCCRTTTAAVAFLRWLFCRLRAVCIRICIFVTILNTLWLYIQILHFFVCKIFCRLGDKNRSIHVNINKNILKPHGSIIIAIIAFGSRLAEFFFIVVAAAHNSFIFRANYSWNTAQNSTIDSVEGQRMLLNVQEVRKIQIEHFNKNSVVMYGGTDRRTS